MNLSERYRNHKQVELYEALIIQKDRVASVALMKAGANLTPVYRSHASNICWSNRDETFVGMGLKKRDLDAVELAANLGSDFTPSDITSLLKMKSSHANRLLRMVNACSEKDLQFLPFAAANVGNREMLDHWLSTCDQSASVLYAMLSQIEFSNEEIFEMFDGCKELLHKRESEASLGVCLELDASMRGSSDIRHNFTRRIMSKGIKGRLDVMVKLTLPVVLNRDEYFAILEEEQINPENFAELVFAGGKLDSWELSWMDMTSLCCTNPEYRRVLLERGIVSDRRANTLAFFDNKSLRLLIRMLECGKLSVQLRARFSGVDNFDDTSIARIFRLAMDENSAEDSMMRVYNSCVTLGIIIPSEAPDVGMSLVIRYLNFTPRPPDYKLK